MGPHKYEVALDFIYVCDFTRIFFETFPIYGLTGKSVLEALILESVHPQYDERLLIKFPIKYKFTTCCVQILF